MLTLKQIINAAADVAKDYPITRIMLFGSYAEGTNTKSSDVDLLIEFTSSAVSLFMLSDIKNRIEDLLGVDVDVIHAPLPENSLINPEKVVEIYAA